MWIGHGLDLNWIWIEFRLDWIEFVLDLDFDMDCILTGFELDLD